MSEELDTWFVIGSKDSLQKSSCGIFAAAVDSAQRTLSTAEQIGNQYLIQSAKDALGVAVSSFMGCVATHPF